jgi:hypothetical protein
MAAQSGTVTTTKNLPLSTVVVPRNADVPLASRNQIPTAPRQETDEKEKGDRTAHDGAGWIDGRPEGPIVEKTLANERQSQPSVQGHGRQAAGPLDEMTEHPHAQDIRRRARRPPPSRDVPSCPLGLPLSSERMTPGV